MARLPSEEQIGALPSALSGRQVATIDTSAIGRGMSNFGEGLSSAGASINNVAERERRAIGDLELATAKSRYLTERVTLDKERDDTLDPAKLEGFGERYKQSRNQAAEAIRDPARRQRFLLDTQDDVAKAGVGVENRSFSLKRDAYLASSQTELDNLRKKGLEAKDETTRASIIETGRARIRAMAGMGYISDVEAQRLDKGWVQGYAFGKLNMMAPSQRIAALTGPAETSEATKGAYGFFVSKGWSPAQAAGIVGNLMAESNLRTHARNAGDGRDGSDSIGIAQWNADRAERLKRYAAARGTDWKDLNTQLEFVDLELRTTHASDNLLKAKTARDAAAAFVTDFEKPAGSNRGAEYSHGWAKRLKHAETFLNAYGGGPAPSKADGADIAGLLPPDQRAQMLERANREEDQQIREGERQLRAQSADVQRAIKDDLASLESKGVELEGMTRAKVATVLGEEAASEWEAERVRARKIHSALDGIETLPEGEVEQRLKSMEPTPGQAGFVDDMKAYERARKKADKFMEARRSDPALAVDVFDTVRTARQNAQYVDENGVRSIAPESAQAIVRSRLTAQQTLGVQEPMAVTRSEARTIARQLRYIGDEDPKGMDRFMRQLEGTYGDLADEVLASALQLENVNRDLAVVATDVIGKIAKGNLPTIARARQFEIAAENQTLATAMDGSVTPAPVQPQAAPTTSDRLNTYQQGLDRQDALRRNAGTRKPGQPEEVTFDAEDIRWLDQNRTNPDAAMNFDLKYGPKAAQRILKDIDRRKGAMR